MPHPPVRQKLRQPSSYSRHRPPEPCFNRHEAIFNHFFTPGQPPRRRPAPDGAADEAEARGRRHFVVPARRRLTEPAPASHLPGAAAALPRAPRHLGCRPGRVTAATRRREAVAPGPARPSPAWHRLPARRRAPPCPARLGSAGGLHAPRPARKRLGAYKKTLK